MTVTLLFWIRVGIYCLIGYTCLKYIINFIRNRRSPSGGKFKKSDIANDIFFTALAVFLLFQLHQRFGKSFNQLLSDKEKIFPEFNYRDANTSQVYSSMDHQSRLLLINYWATWCGPCRREMPDLDKIKKDFPAEDLQIIAISDEDRTTVEQYLKDKNFSFITGTITLTNSFLESIDQRPVSILLDEHGKILDAVIGSRGYSFFHRWVSGYLENPAIGEK